MDAVREVGLRLGVLASWAAQERHMVNATADQYLLIEEAIDCALEIGEQKLLLSMDGHTKQSATRFLEVLRREVDMLDSLPRMPWPLAVLHDPALTRVREAAQACLTEIGFDLASWERAEGYSA